MAESQRPGEITYYDELGVAKSATPDEIRDAFRTLVRLLHPDQQTDPLLREMAERQMRKLNGIYGVLSDSSKRATYDDSLNVSTRSAPVIVFSGSDPKLRRLLLRAGIAAFVIFGIFMVIWAAVDNNSNSASPELRAASKANESADSDSADQIAQLRAQLRTVETERNSALLQLERMREKEADGDAAKSTPAGKPAAATTLSELAPAERTAPAANAPAEFAGTWVYSKASGAASAGGKSQYSPESIELTVTTQNGTLRGQYRSRYQVLDHASSPYVNFDFFGKPIGSALTCLWRGPGGAKGRMTLKLVSAGAAEIAWNATDLGSEQWLLNGTATLSRK